MASREWHVLHAESIGLYRRNAAPSYVISIRQPPDLAYRCAPSSRQETSRSRFAFLLGISNAKVVPNLGAVPVKVRCYIDCLLAADDAPAPDSSGGRSVQLSRPVSDLRSGAPRAGGVSMRCTCRNEESRGASTSRILVGHLALRSQTCNASSEPTNVRADFWWSANLHCDKIPRISMRTA